MNLVIFLDVQLKLVFTGWILFLPLSCYFRKGVCVVSKGKEHVFLTFRTVNHKLKNKITLGSS